MKTFREFILEASNSVKDATYTGDAAEQERIRQREARRGFDPDKQRDASRKKNKAEREEFLRKKSKNTNVSGENVRGTGTTQTSPQQSPSQQQAPRQPSAATPPPSKPPTSNVPSAPTKPPSTAKGPNLRTRLGRIANPVSAVASGVMDYKARREAGQSQARSAGGAVASGAGWAKGASLGMKVPAPLPVKLAAAGIGGLFGDAAASAAYDFAADKTRPARQAVSKTTGFDKFQQKSALIKQGSGLQKAQQTIDTRDARKVAAQSGTYGAKGGSALTGIGGKTSFDKKAATITTGGKTAKLASTQLVRDPKTGQNRVGDLAYKGGKAVYLARPSVASRDTSLGANIQRALNIGRNSKSAEQQAAKTEYKSALKNTQTYQKQLGITPKAAVAQKLPGSGVVPKK